MNTSTFTKLFFLFLIAQSIYCQVPQTINYQGILTNTSGIAVTDGNYSITFKLYDAITGGSNVWTETQSVATNKGIFQVILGNVNVLNLPFDKPYFLGMSISSGAELTPRIQLTSTPYSLNSQQVKGSSNIFAGNGYVGVGTLTPRDRLEVKDFVSITGSGNEGGQLTLKDGDDLGGWEIDNYGNSGQEMLRMYRGRGTDNVFDAFNIKVNGNVGIGTTNPAEKLDVNGIIKSSIGGFRFPDGSLQTTAATSSVGTSWNHTATQNINLNNHWLSPDGSDKGLFIKTSGSKGLVGIGTSNPTDDFEVNGIIKSTTGGYKFPDGTVQTTAATSSGGGSFTLPYIGSGSSSSSLFSVTNTSSLSAAGVTKSAGYFEATGTSGYGIVSKGNSFGITSSSSSSTGIGVYGEAIASTGINYGVEGKSTSTSGAGVEGIHGTSGKYGLIGGNDYGVKTNGDLVVNDGAYRGNLGQGDGAPFPREAYSTGWVNVATWVGSGSFGSYFPWVDIDTSNLSGYSIEDLCLMVQWQKTSEPNKIYFSGNDVVANIYLNGSGTKSIRVDSNIGTSVKARILVWVIK